MRLACRWPCVTNAWCTDRDKQGTLAGGAATEGTGMPGFLTCTGGKCACRGVVCWMRSYQRTRFWNSVACPTGKFFCYAQARPISGRHSAETLQLQLPGRILQASPQACEQGWPGPGLPGLGQSWSPGRCAPQACHGSAAPPPPSQQVHASKCAGRPGLPAHLLQVGLRGQGEVVAECEPVPDLGVQLFEASGLKPSPRAAQVRTCRPEHRLSCRPPAAAQP